MNQMISRQARFQTGETAYYLEEGELVAVKVLENKCSQDRLEYRLKCLELVRPGNIPVYEPEAEFTCSGIYVKLFDETELESYFGIKKLTDEEKIKQDTKITQQEDRLLKIVARKRKEYLENRDLNNFYVYQTFSGRKLTEIDDSLYFNNGEFSRYSFFKITGKDNPIIQGKAVIIGSLPSEYFYPQAVFDPEALEKLIPTIEIGNRVIAYEQEFLFQTEDRKNEYPHHYVSTPVEKIFKAKKEDFAGKKVEEIVESLFKLLEVK